MFRDWLTSRENWGLVLKFMLTLEEFVYKELEKVAKKRGIGMQELIRAVIVPEWMKVHGATQR